MRAHHRLPAVTTLGVTGLLLLSACGGGASGAAPSDPSTTPLVASSTSASASPSAADPTQASPVADPTSASDSASVPAPPAASAGGSACSLVTEQEVATVLKKDPGAGRPFTSHGASQCQYGSYQTAFVLVNLLPTQGRADYDHAHNDPHISDAGTIADVADVGDEAFSIAGPMTASIYFTSGDALVLVSVEIYGVSASPMDQALALATIAAGRV